MINTLRVQDLVLSKPMNQSQSNERITILKGINTKFESGRLNAIMGPNGCGKTTLLDILSGYCSETTETSGKILFNELERNTTDWLKNVTYIAQDPNWIEDQTARAAIQFSIDIKNSESGQKSKLKDFTSIFNELYIMNLLDKNLKMLSGGELQRVNLAVELVMERSILILDEPTSDLDSHLALNLLIFLKQLATDKGIMIIFTIHQPTDKIFEFL